MKLKKCIELKIIEGINLNNIKSKLEDFGFQVEYGFYGLNIGDKVKLKKINRIDEPSFDLFVSKFFMENNNAWVILTDKMKKFFAYVPIDQIIKVKEDK